MNARYLIQELKNSQETYELLLEKKQWLVKARILETDPATQFKLDKQIEGEIDPQLQQAKQQIELLEREISLAQKEINGQEQQIERRQQQKFDAEIKQKRQKIILLEQKISLSQCKQEQEFQKTNLIPYKIIRREENKKFKVAFDVLVDRIDYRVPTKEELAAVSTNIYSQEPPHERTFVSFYLPGMEPGYGAFATAHHNPDLEVQILSHPLPYDKATRFNTIQEMIEEFNDFHEEDGTFKILVNTASPHIQLSPTVFSDEFPEVIREELKRTIIYGIFRTFIHTDYNELTVTAIPLEINIPDGNIRRMTKKYLENYSMTVSSTRNRVESCTTSLLNFNSLQELVETQIIANVPLRDRWTSSFEKWLDNDDERYPRLNILFDSLIN